MSILPDDKADIFATSLLISYCSFSTSVGSLIIILLYIYLKIFFLNLKGLSDGRVVSLTKKEHGSAVNFFMDLYKIFKTNIWWMI